jgi:3-aminobutyryl-CoA ammonia-lyase
MALPEAFIRLRMGSEDAHYGGELVAGATMLKLFGDLITELAIKQDGDEGLFRAYESVEFLAPVHAGDFIEARGRIVNVGNTSRKCEFEAWKVITVRPDISESAADMLDEPVLVCKAVGTTVVTKENQRLASSDA